MTLKERTEPLGDIGGALRGAMNARESWRRASAAMRSERFSARTYDAGGGLDERKLREIRGVVEAFGAVHVQHTGLGSVAGASAAMDHLGFAGHERFSAGGRTSASWQRKWVEPGLRRLDYYPPELYLLPNNEVQYRRCSPRWVLFYCQQAPDEGGRTFVHSAAAVADALGAAGPPGAALLEKFARHGLMIETGFLDQRDPRKADNYFQSWQERFETEDPEKALARAQGSPIEHDACWWREEALRDAQGRPLCTLMTRITLTAFKRDPHSGQRYLRFPRVALDGPGAHNGYRRFPLGNGEELSEDERALLLAVYLSTREGLPLRAGDLVLFDNMRYGHSRESFAGERHVCVGMAGELWDDATPQAALQARGGRPSAPIPRAATPAGSPERYRIAPEHTDRGSRFSARTFDAGGALDADGSAAIREQLARHGAVHVKNTGLRCAHGGALPDETLRALGFGGDEAFPWGGMSSGRTTRRALSRELRATDEYPAHLWLLPHNEVLYQRRMPARLLFFSALDGPPERGGRTFVHSAEATESWLRARGRPGAALLDELRAHGFLIEMGFLDERHPAKASNYFRSWQDRFDTPSRPEAEARCRASRLQFDECWWVEEPGARGAGWPTLMTRVRVPAFFRDPHSHRESLFFPRIALDAAGLTNGHRRYPLGNGREFTDGEIDLLLGAFLATREGVHWSAGDLLLVDNARYGHSRESFDGERSIGVAMAGVISIEPGSSPR